MKQCGNEVQALLLFYMTVYLALLQHNRALLFSHQSTPKRHIRAALWPQEMCKCSLTIHAEVHRFTFPSPVVPGASQRRLACLLLLGASVHSTEKEIDQRQRVLDSLVPVSLVPCKRIHLLTESPCLVHFSVFIVTGLCAGFSLYSYILTRHSPHHLLSTSTHGRIEIRYMVASFFLSCPIGNLQWCELSRQLQLNHLQRSVLRSTVTKRPNASRPEYKHSQKKDSLDGLTHPGNMCLIFEELLNRLEGVAYCLRSEHTRRLTNLAIAQLAHYCQVMTKTKTVHTDSRVWYFTFPY